MKNLLRTINKNIRLILRSKASALIIIIAPILLFLLVGSAYNHAQTYSLTLGVFSSNVDTAQPVIDLLSEQEFKVVKYNSSETCLADLKLGYLNTCLSLPTDMTVTDNTQKEVVFYADRSDVNLVWMVSDTIKTKLNLKSKEISTSLTEELLNKISAAKAKLSDKNALVEEIKTRETAAAAAIDSANQRLGGMDVALVGGTYNESSLTSLKSLITEESGKMSASLISAKSQITGLNLSSSDQNSIIAYLDSSIINLANIDKEFSGNGSYTTFNSLFTVVKNDLIAANNKLQAAATLKDGITEEVSTIKSSLDVNSAALDVLQQTMGEIVSSLSDVKVSSAATIANPLVTKVEYTTAKKTYFNYIFPSLLIIVMMFVGLLLGTTLVMMEKHSPAHFRNFISPVSKTTFILANYITTLLIIIIQTAIIFTISWYFFSWQGAANIPAMLLVLFLAASVFTFLGMLVGYIFSTEDTAILTAASLGSLFLFFSGIILPLESVPTLIKQVTVYSPFVISESLLKEILLYSSTLDLFVEELLLLFGYALVLCLLILIVEEFASRHFIHKFLYRHHHKQKPEEKK